MKSVRDLTIAVTGLNATDNPGPGTPVIRSLRDIPGFRGRIIGLLYDTLDPGAYIPGVADRVYLIPYPSSGTQAMLDRIRYIHQQENLDFILPTLDTEIYTFQQIAVAMQEMGIHSFLPTIQQNALRAKDKLAAFCRQNGVKVPRTEVVTSEIELEELLSDISFPAVIKGIFYDASIVTSLGEAKAAFQRIRHKWGLPLILQEFLSGDEYNVATLGDGQGQALGAVAMRKLTITDKGKGWAGVTIYDHTLDQISAEIIRKLAWTGGAELEYIKERESGEYYLLEINPRFPAWIHLATAAGQNMPAAMIELALNGIATPLPAYETGKVFVRYSWDEITSMSHLEQLTMQRCM